MTTSMNEQTHFFIKIYLSHFILERVDVGCVWEVSSRREQTAILTPSSSGHSSPQSAACSHAGILSPIDSNWLEPPQAPGYIIVWYPPASAVLPLIYTGASLDWWLGWGSVCYTGRSVLAVRHDDDDNSFEFRVFPLLDWLIKQT